MRTLGRYQLESVQGSGAFATVWRGFDAELQIPVAIKVLAENWSHHADVRQRFIEEARLLRRVASDRVIRVYDVDTDADQPYFVMDFAAGGTLADHVDGALPTLQAVDLAAQACRAVHVLHEAGVVHRDVKPGNLLLTGEREVVVADLGSVKRLAEASGYTVTTGTPAYMAPEQAAGAGLDARADVYSLAVVAYVLAAGALPFDVSDPTAPLRRTETDRPSPLPHRDLDAVLRRALSCDPRRRHPSALALAEDLERVVRGEAVDRPGWPLPRVVVAAAGAFATGSAAGWFGLTWAGWA